MSNNTSTICNCTGIDYQGCLKLPNGLFTCTKKDGSIDDSRTCLGEKKIGDDGVEGWTKACDKLTFSDLKDRLTNWCTKLYQDGVYDYNQYQDCLQNLETGTVSYYKDDPEKNVDDNKDPKRVYGYYPKGRESIENINPNKPVIKDDFQRMTIYSLRDKGYLATNKTGKIRIVSDSDIREEMEWQLVGLGGDKVYGIRSAHYGKFLIGNDKGNVQVVSENISPWSQWKLIKYNNAFAFQSVSHNKYLTFDGEKAFMKEGWSDNNLWIIKEKIEPNGLGSFDNSELTLKKDELLQSMNNNYRKAVDNLFLRDYYKNKVPVVRFLRDQQKRYLTNISIVREKELNARKGVLVKDISVLIKRLNYNKQYKIQEYEAMVRKNESECKMSEYCLDKAVELNGTSNSTFGIPGSFLGFASFSSIGRRNRNKAIMNEQQKCNWTNTQTYKIISNTFEVPSPEYCKKLQENEDTIRDALSSNREEILKLIDEKNAMIKDINYQMVELQLFRNEINDSFSILNETEKKELLLLSDNEEKNRIKNMDSYRKYSKDINSFISYLSTSNKELERQISNSSKDIDVKLQINNKLEQEIDYNKKSTLSEEDSEIIDVNQKLITSQVSSIKTTFYLELGVIIISILVILYIGYRTYHKFMD